MTDYYRCLCDKINQNTHRKNNGRNNTKSESFDLEASFKRNDNHRCLI